MTDAVTRVLKFDSGGSSVDVLISVAWPTLDDKTWTCSWKIEWPDRTRSSVGCGIDAMQALFMALQMIGTDIYCSAEHKSGYLGWTDDTTGYGVPVPHNLRDLLIGDDAKYL